MPADDYKPLENPQIRVRGFGRFDTRVVIQITIDSGNKCSIVFRFISDPLSACTGFNWDEPARTDPDWPRWPRSWRETVNMSGEITDSEEDPIGPLGKIQDGKLLLRRIWSSECSEMIVEEDCSIDLTASADYRAQGVNDAEITGTMPLVDAIDHIIEFLQQQKYPDKLTLTDLETTQTYLKPATARADAVCACCLEPIDETRRATELGCAHQFHDDSDCHMIRFWLVRHQTCPVCRQSCQ